jgi:signal transduction histidine kinase
VFLLDRDSWNHKRLQLMKITASRVGTELERQLLQIRAEQTSVVQERQRLFRDLHDGLLQSLAAAGFQIKLLSEGSADGIASRLGTLKELLAKEQNRIRAAIEEDRQRPAGEELALNGHSHEMLSQAARPWNCATSIKVTPVDAKLPRGLFDELPFIFNEAVANAVRHGRASRVDVSIHRTDRQLIVCIRDNGLGFAGASAAVQRSGPVVPPIKPGSICERVRKLGGSVSVRGTENGTELTITMTVP